LDNQKLAPNPNTFFTQLPGVLAKSATGHVPIATTIQEHPDGRPVQLFASQSIPGTWLYPYQPEAKRTAQIGR